MKKAITILFFIVLACDVFSLATENQMLRMIAKPLLMPLVVSIYLLYVGKKASFLFVSALFFSFWGDVLLLFKEYFILGLVSFLMTHIFYIVIISNFLKRKSKAEFIKWIIPFLVYFSVIIVLIYPNLETLGKLNELLGPILVYGIAISIFGMITLVNYLQNKSKENLTLLIGSFLFIISDSCIAINEFYNPQMIFELSIMILYGIAQYLICKVMILKNEKTSSMW